MPLYACHVVDKGKGHEETFYVLGVDLQEATSLAGAYVKTKGLESDAIGIQKVSESLVTAKGGLV